MTVACSIASFGSCVRVRRPAAGARGLLGQERRYVSFHFDEAEAGEGALGLHQSIDALSVPAYVETLYNLLKFFMIKIFQINIVEAIAKNPRILFKELLPQALIAALFCLLCFRKVLRFFE